MEGSKERSSSAKRKQLHPKKQVNQQPESPQKNDGTKSKAATVKSPEETQKKLSSSIPGIIITSDTILKSSMIDSSTNIQTSNAPTEQNIEIPADAKSPKEDKPEMESIHLEENVISDLVNLNQIGASINIDTMKISLKQKLDIILSDADVNKLHNARISLVQRKKIAEQKMRKFFMDASLPTTIIRNTNGSKIKWNFQSDNAIKQEKNETQQMISKVKTKGSTKKMKLIKRKNISKDKTSIAFNKKGKSTKVKTREPKQKMKINGNIVNKMTTRSSAFNNMGNSDCSNFLIKKVIITPHITSATKKKSEGYSAQQMEEFDAVIEVASSNANDEVEFISDVQTAKLALSASEYTKVEAPKCFLEVGSIGTTKIDTIPKNADEQTISLKAYKQSTSKTNEMKNTSSMINSKDTDQYVACLQTVKPSSGSTIKALASIRKLREPSSENLLETSENILDFNIDMINLINKLSTMTNNSNSAGEIPSKVSINKLEEALTFALGKKPKTITIIRKPKESNDDTNTKLSVTYIDKLDSALDSALGSNSKLLPFVKKLVNSSVSNFMKANLSRKNSLNNLQIDQTRNRIDNEKNKSLRMKLNKESKHNLKYKFQETSDTEDCLGFDASEIPKSQNAKFINLFNKFPETFSIFDKKINGHQEQLIKSHVNYVVPVVKLSPENNKKINIISMQKGLALKSVAKPSQIYRKNIVKSCGNKPIILRRYSKPNTKPSTSGIHSKKCLEKLPESKIQTKTLPAGDDYKKPTPQFYNNLEKDSEVKPCSPIILKRSVNVTKSNQNISKDSNKLSMIAPVKLIEATIPTKISKPVIIKKLIKKSSVDQTNVNAVKQQTNMHIQRNLEGAEGNVINRKPAAVNIAEIAKKQFLANVNLRSKEEISPKGKPEIIKRKLGELYRNQVGIKKQSPLEQRAYNMASRKETGLDEMPPLKRIKMMNDESLFGTASKSSQKQSDDTLKSIDDFSSLQANIKAILESNIYKNIISLNVPPSIKLEAKKIHTKYGLKRLSSFALMHDIITTILESPQYQRILTLAKDSKKLSSADTTVPAKQHDNSLSTSNTGTSPLLPPVQSSIKEPETFDPNTIDTATLKSSSTVPDTLLPLLDKEEDEEVYERFIIEHVWNENKNQDLSIFYNSKKD